jgi:hypothetical protein
VVFSSIKKQILPKRLHSADMAVFTSLNDRGQLFSTENTPVVFGTATIDFLTMIECMVCMPCPFIIVVGELGT